MGVIEKIILGFISLFFIFVGIVCTFKSTWAYEYNLKRVGNFANLVRNVPYLGPMMQSHVKAQKSLTIGFFKFWGMGAWLIGLINLFVILTK